MARSSQEPESENQVDAIELLTQQHREVESLFAELEKTSNRAVKARQQFVAELARKIEAHAKIEEKIFYPEGCEVDEAQTLEALEEHSVVRYLVRRLTKTEPQDETFSARVSVLKEMIQHHVEEEEQEYFPKVREELGEERLLELGSELLEAYERLEGTGSKKGSSSGRATSRSSAMAESRA